jgi:hypothetical protein
MKLTNFRSRSDITVREENRALNFALVLLR